ncbi:MAG: signal peptidase I, partial [Thermofilaceae archaeon]
GDVIVYVSPTSGLIVHRVIKVQETLRGTEFITKGDANLAPDAEPVPAQRVKGRVDIVIPYIGVVRLAFERLLQGLRGF